MDPALLLAGIASGSLYGLVAVGFNILLRPTNVFNLAQGEIVMLGGMIGASAALGLAMPWIAAAGLAILAGGILGLIEETVAVAPVLRRSATGTAWVTTTLAFSLITSNLVGHIWGPDPLKMNPPAPLSMASFDLLGVRTNSYQLGVILVAILIVILVERFYRTRAGKAVQAVAEDREAALLRGIDPDSLSRWSFILGGGFAGLIGVLAAPMLNASTDMGPLLLLKGFEATAVGGVGSNRGALVAGYMLGLSEAIGASLLTPGYQQASTFILLLAVLMIRPHGLFGHQEVRHV